MKNIKPLKLSLLILLLVSSKTFAQDSNDDWKFSGQIQLRSELDGRDFRHITHPLTFASLRTRVGVEKTFMDKVTFFAQIQDSRIFGEEGNTLAAIDNIDLHQGYVILKNLFDWDWDIQGGRFQFLNGTERFFGLVDWHYVGRAWDGIRFRYGFSQYKGFRIDLFALTHTESVGYIGNATPGIYPYPAESTPSYSVFGIFESSMLNDQNQLDLFGYYEVNRTKISTDNIALSRFTLETTHYGNFGNISTIFEGAYQFGELSGLDISAYLLSLQGFYNTGKAKFGLGADILSGDNSPDKYESFSPSFGTNHKFYGYMDYFINIPSNTIGLGLNDFYGMILYQPKDSKFSCSADVHYFMSNEPFQSIFSIDPTIQEKKSIFGQEIDLTIKYNFIKGTTITWGGSVFIPGELMRLIFAPANDVAFWSYVMITANI